MPCKWHAHWQADGEAGLADRSSAPEHSPARTPGDIEDMVDKLRRETKYGAARLAAVIEAEHGIVLAPVTVHSIMVRRGINRVADLEPADRRPDARGPAVRTRRPRCHGPRGREEAGQDPQRRWLARSRRR